MSPDYPNDSDGDALRRVRSSGNDMTRQMVIEFPVVFKSEQSAKQFAGIATRGLVDVHISKHHHDPAWDVVCSMLMVPTHAEVVRIQQQLTNWAAGLGGYCNSWGTFGNAAGIKPSE